MRINKKLCLWAMLACALICSVKLAADPAQAAEKTAISSADDLRAMERDPSGSYYLTADIVVPEGMTLFSMNNKFTGTFDGKGHTLKNYKLDVTSSDLVTAALFAYADGAKFKNLNMTGVDIRVSSGDGGAIAAALVASAGQSTFDNIRVSGSIQATGGGSYDGCTGVTVAGLVGTGGKKYVKCQSSVNLTMDVSSQYNPQYAAGLAGAGVFGSPLDQALKNCSYSGKINVKAVVSGMPDEDMSLSVAGLAIEPQSMSGCKNSGTIKVNADGYARVAGLANEVEKKISACKNSGKLAVTVNGGTKMEIGGIVGYIAGTVTKCANTGSITVTDKSNGNGQIGGIGGYVYKISQSYNKGAVKVTSAKSLGHGKDVGGLVGSVRDCRNNYNTGAVTLSGEGNVGRLAGHTEGFDERVIYNYSTGKVKGKGASCGNLIGRYDGPDAANPVRMSYDCYYTQSGNDVGSSGVDWHEWTAKNKKVSSITSANCPKLSSKYWKYSSSAKRLILKNNPEK